MRVAKQIVFRYNGDLTTEVPKQGSFVERKGERWKVVQVKVERSVTEPFEVPIHRVFLTNKL